MAAKAKAKTDIIPAGAKRFLTVRQRQQLRQAAESGLAVLLRGFVKKEVTKGADGKVRQQKEIYVPPDMAAIKFVLQSSEYKTLLSTLDADSPEKLESDETESDPLQRFARELFSESADRTDSEPDLPPSAPSPTGREPPSAGALSGPMPTGHGDSVRDVLLDVQPEEPRAQAEPAVHPVAGTAGSDSDAGCQHQRRERSTDG